MSNSNVQLDLAPGEAFLRVNVNEDGMTQFACGFYPRNSNIEKDFDPENDIDHDDMLAIFMSGIANLIQNDMDTILRAGLEYSIEGHRPFDFIVSPDDLSYYKNLTNEDLQLLRMDIEGEA
jgi:hypothetical protein